NTEAPGAWNVTTGSPDVVVAVLDTGVDTEHEDLRENIWTNPNEISGNGIDDDGNGYVDDVHGLNALTGTGDVRDDHGHGTHVAGIIGAAANNGVGVSGVAWRPTILPLEFLAEGGSGPMMGAITALRYARQLKSLGVNTVAENASWGGTAFSQALFDEVRALADADITLVA